MFVFSFFITVTLLFYSCILLSLYYSITILLGSYTITLLYCYIILFYHYSVIIIRNFNFIQTNLNLLLQINLSLK